MIIRYGEAHAARFGRLLTFSEHFAIVPYLLRQTNQPKAIFKPFEFCWIFVR